jgi:hypothetical protein
MARVLPAIEEIAGLLRPFAGSSLWWVLRAGRSIIGLALRSSFDTTHDVLLTVYRRRFSNQIEATDTTTIRIRFWFDERRVGYTNASD